MITNLQFIYVSNLLIVNNCMNQCPNNSSLIIGSEKKCKFVYFHILKK